ncbi:uncharacterized protein [Ptychodera flava]|uniref:uncharacterized protein n=1 Tax=Ptychodera flava TaxID=63121 RepID=UPI00396A6706
MCEEADPVPWDKIPSKPEDFQAMWDTDIGVTDGGVSENHILVNMSWSIDVLRRYKPTGFHVSLMGLTDHGEYKYHYFRQTLCATFDLSEDNFTDIDGPTLQYFFDCFRPLSPYCDYQLVVRTLPYTDETSPDGQIGPHSTLHSERFRTPSCGDPEISKTAECQVQPGEEAAYWQPVHLTPYSPTYHKITAKFDLPPESYGIYEYKILIYRYTVESSRCSGYVATETVDKNDTRVSIYNDTVGGRHYTFLEYTLNGKFDGRHYCMKMTPGPDDACTIPDKGIDRCRTTTSEGFEVLDDPCVLDPCGDHGNCTGLLDEDFYECHCDPGYIALPAIYPTCQVDTCYWKPCGEGGICIPVLNSTEYSCNCSDNYYSEENTCKVDPCLLDLCGVPDTHNCSSLNSTYYKCNCLEGFYFDDVCKVDYCYENPCGHGECIRVDSGYTCNCTSGHYHDGKVCTPLVKDPGVIIAGVIGALLGIALLMVLAVYYWRKWQYPPVYVPRRGESPSDGVEGIPHPRVFLLYAEDGVLHKNVIQSMADFLFNQLNCDVHLYHWELEMAAADLTNWLIDQKEKADKVVIIASRGTQRQTSINQRQGGGSCEMDGGVFSVALNIMSGDLRNGKHVGKYINVHFDIKGYSEEEHIPELCKVIMDKSFKLPQQLEAFYLHLRGLSSGSFGGHRVVVGFKEMFESRQGIELQKSITTMKRYVLRHQDWFENQNRSDTPQTVDDLDLSVNLQANGHNEDITHDPLHQTLFSNGHTSPFRESSDQPVYRPSVNGYAVHLQHSAENSLTGNSQTTPVNRSESITHINPSFDPEVENQSHTPTPKKRNKRAKGTGSLKVKFPEKNNRPTGPTEADNNNGDTNQIDTGYFSEDFSPSTDGPLNCPGLPVSHSSERNTETPDGEEHVDQQQQFESPHRYYAPTDLATGIYPSTDLPVSHQFIAPTSINRHSSSTENTSSSGAHSAEDVDILSTCSSLSDNFALIQNLNNKARNTDSGDISEYIHDSIPDPQGHENIVNSPEFQYHL